MKRSPLSPQKYAAEMYARRMQAQQTCSAETSMQQAGDQQVYSSTHTAAHTKSFAGHTQSHAAAPSPVHADASLPARDSSASSLSHDVSSVSSKQQAVPVCACCAGRERNGTGIKPCMTCTCSTRKPSPARAILFVFFACFAGLFSTQVHGMEALKEAFAKLFGREAAESTVAISKSFKSKIGREIEVQRFNVVGKELGEISRVLDSARDLKVSEKSMYTFDKGTIKGLDAAEYRVKQIEDPLKSSNRQFERLKEKYGSKEFVKETETTKLSDQLTETSNALKERAKVFEDAKAKETFEDKATVDKHIEELKAKAEKLDTIANEIKKLKPEQKLSIGEEIKPATPGEGAGAGVEELEEGSAGSKAKNPKTGVSEEGMSLKWAGMTIASGVLFSVVNWVQMAAQAAQTNAEMEENFTEIKLFGGLELVLVDDKCYNKADPTKSFLVYKLKDDKKSFADLKHVFVSSGSSYGGAACYQTWGSSGLSVPGIPFTNQMIDVATGLEFDGAGNDAPGSLFPRQINGPRDVFYAPGGYNDCPTTMREFSKILSARAKGLQNSFVYNPASLFTPAKSQEYKVPEKLKVDLADGLFNETDKTSIVDRSVDNTPVKALAGFKVLSDKVTLKPFIPLTQTEWDNAGWPQAIKTDSDLNGFKPAAFKMTDGGFTNPMTYGVHVYQTGDTPLAKTITNNKPTDSPIATFYDYVITLDADENIVPGYKPLIANGTITWGSNPNVTYLYSIIDGTTYEINDAKGATEKLKIASTDPEHARFVATGQPTNDQLLYAKYVKEPTSGGWGAGVDSSQTTTLFDGNMGRQVMIMRKFAEDIQANAPLTVGGYVLTNLDTGDSGIPVYAIEAAKNNSKTTVPTSDTTYATDYVVPTDATLKTMAIGADKSPTYLASLVTSTIYKPDGTSLAIVGNTGAIAGKAGAKDTSATVTFNLYYTGDTAIAWPTKIGGTKQQPMTTPGTQIDCKGELSTALGTFYQEAQVNAFNTDSSKSDKVKAAQADMTRGIKPAKAYAAQCLIPFGPLTIYNSLPWGPKQSSIASAELTLATGVKLSDAIAASHTAWIAHAVDTLPAGPFAFTTMLVPNIMLTATSGDDLTKGVYVYTSPRYPGDYLIVSSSGDAIAMEPFNSFAPQQFLVSLKTGNVYKRNDDTGESEVYGTVSLSKTLDTRSGVIQAIIDKISGQNSALGKQIQNPALTGIINQGPFVLLLTKDDAKGGAFIYQQISGFSKQTVEDVLLNAVVGGTAGTKDKPVTVVDYLVTAQKGKSDAYEFNKPVESIRTESNPGYLVSILTGTFYNIADGTTASDATLELPTDTNAATYFIGKQKGVIKNVSENTYKAISDRALEALTKPSGKGTTPAAPADPLAGLTLSTPIDDLIAGSSSITKFIVPLFAALRLGDSAYAVSPTDSGTDAAIKTAFNYSNGAMFMATKDDTTAKAVAQYSGDLLNAMRRTAGIADNTLHVPQPIIGFEWKTVEDLKRGSETGKHLKYPDGGPVTLTFGANGYYGSLPGSYTLHVYKHINGGYGIMADYVSSLTGDAGTHYWIDMYSGNRFKAGAKESDVSPVHIGEYPVYADNATGSTKIVALSGYDDEFNPRAILAPSSYDASTYYLWTYNGAHGSYAPNADKPDAKNKNDAYVRLQSGDNVLLLGSTFAATGVAKHFNPTSNTVSAYWGSGAIGDDGVTGMSDTATAFTKTGTGTVGTPSTAESIRFYTYIGSDISGASTPPAFGNQSALNAATAGWLVGVSSDGTTLAGDPHKFMVVGTVTGDAFTAKRIYVPLVVFDANASDVEAYGEFVVDADATGTSAGTTPGKTIFKPAYTYDGIGGLDDATRLTLAFNQDATTQAPYAVLTMPQTKAASSDTTSTDKTKSSTSSSTGAKTHHYFIPDAEIVEGHTLFAVQRALNKYVAQTAYGDLLLFDPIVKSNLKSVAAVLNVPAGDATATANTLLTTSTTTGGIKGIVKEEIGETDGTFGRYLYAFGSGLITDEDTKLYYRADTVKYIDNTSITLHTYVDLRTGVVYRDDYYEPDTKIRPTGIGLSLIELQMLMSDLGIAVPSIPVPDQELVDGKIQDKKEGGKTVYIYDNLTLAGLYANFNQTFGSGTGPVAKDISETRKDLFTDDQISKASTGDIPFVRYAVPATPAT